MSNTLEELLAEYWDAAYAEGVERMDYDTEDGRAQRALSALRGHYAALETRHNALREAVEWERECCQDIRPLVAWAGLYVRHGEDYVDAIAEALREIQDAARAEVDMLIGENK